MRSEFQQCGTGRDVMPQYGLEPQAVITYELLVGTDGVEKMAKSVGNYVGIFFSQSRSW